MILLAAIHRADPPTMFEVVSPLVGVFVVSLILSLALTPVMRKLAIRNGIVDWPDLKRKAHVEPIAYLGGLALFLGWLGGVVASYFLTYPLGPDGPTKFMFPVTVIFGATIITLTGLADDIFGMSPRVKIGGQFITAAALTWKSDIGVRLFQDVFLNLHMTSLPMTPTMHTVCYILGAAFITVMVVGGCNSLNLLDGLDGLASGVTAIAAIGFLFLAAYLAVSPTRGGTLADPIRIVMCLALLGAVLGFLPYNFNPASIFMGDAGSLLLGYLSISVILEFAHTSYVGPLLVMASLIIFALPITDTTLAIIRRKMRGQPIFSPDNQHLHHLCLRFAQRRGLGPRASVKLGVLLMYAFAAIFAVLGCALGTLAMVEDTTQHRWRYVLAVFLVFFGSILVIAYRAGHRYAVAAKAGAAEAVVAKPEINDTSGENRN